MAKTDGIAYVACTCPDIDLDERFLGDFGTVRAACDAGTLNIRGAGPRHHIYVASDGEATGFDCVAFTAVSAADLGADAMLEGASAVPPIEAPGLGHVLFKVRDFQRTFDWYRHKLGMSAFDLLVGGPENRNLVAFRPCDRGAAFTDHHTVTFLPFWDPPVPADFLD
jgi:hypothetical protein